MSYCNTNTNIQNSRILIIQQRDWALRIGHPLALHLHTHYDVTLGAVTIKPTTHDFISTQQDVPYEKIFYSDLIKTSPESIGDLDSISLADICKELAIDSIWPLAQASRNHIYNYEKKYYYSFKQGRSDEDIIKFVKSTFLHVKLTLDSFNPDIIITPNFAGLQHIIYSLLCKKRSIAIIGAIDTKIQGITGITYDHLGHNSNFLERFHQLENGENSKNRDRAQEYLDTNRKQLTVPYQDLSGSQKVLGNQKISSNSIGLKHIFRMLLVSIKETIKFYLYTRKNKVENMGVFVDYRPPYYIFRDNFQSIIHRRNHENYSGYADMKKLKKYVYFPLQVQPEATINIHATRFNNQIEVARQISLCLPDDYCLVVKEHPAMTFLRPISYIDKIANLPNVKVVDFRTSSDQILRHSKLVVSPSSSTISEAAYINIPVIQLGDLGSTKVYPNVIHHNNFTTLSAVIKKCLNSNLSSDETYEKTMINIISAVYDVGLKDSYNTLYSAPIGSFDKESLELEVISWLENEMNQQLELR